tara:strand:+ start:20998 stop:21372 length:375 start_codon:yes stop_codon:yes gene_type:complete
MSFLLISMSAGAHHSFDMFDRGNPIQISGEVKEFQWVNPHTWIQILVTDDASGEIVEWSIEGRSPNALVRRGWSRNTILTGEQLTLTIYPLRNGRAGGAIATVEKADGTIINADTPSAVDPDEE